MRHSIVLAVMLLAPLASASAQTVTARDLVELSKAGLGEDVLLALIEVHRPVFSVDTETLKGLKDAGLPPKVIVAMIRSGREDPPEPAPLAPGVASVHEQAPRPPQVVIMERERYHEGPRVLPVAVPVPVYVPVRVRPTHRAPPKRVEPVYWGFGGQLRPDAWKPTAADVQKDAKLPREPQKK